MPQNSHFLANVRRELGKLSLDELADKYAETANNTQEVYRIEMLRRQTDPQITAAQATGQTACYTRRLVTWTMVAALVAVATTIISEFARLVR